jgi:dienelactone hydrolase
MDSLEKAGEAIGMRPGVVHTHNGFCKAASALIPKLSEKLRRLLNNVSQGTVDVVFTGHSAGGATAMLLFTHLLTKAADCMLSYGTRVY